ncbi:methyl-accepting chemotaxis protein, partial [Pseudoxanthomonas japonensis]|uniref:MCP four helix bundle domain-containing protein n=1 Tax=Pseudoxanthomonas japonensis TaxID=69284 RepID=UPI00285C5BB1
MTWFQNLPIARKLAMAFTVTTALTLLLGGFSLWRLNVGNDQMRDVNENWMPAVQHLGEMRAQLGEFRTFEQAQLTKQGDAAELADYDKRLADTRKLIEAEEAGYNAIPAESSPEELALYEKVEAARAAYFGAHDRIAAAIAADDFETAKAISGSDSRKLRRDLFDHLKTLSQYNVDNLATNVTASRKAHERTVMAMVGGLVLVLALAGLLGWSISRSIAMPVAEAVRVANDVAAGKLDGKIDTSRSDEVGQLLTAMQRMQHQVVALIAALAEMTRRHDEGQISFRIDDSGFPGDYGRMVRDTNTLVASHIEVKMRLAEVMQRYSIGDLSMDMDRLPGEKAVLTETMDATKASLSAINAEIKRLARAASSGDFSQRGDVDKYQYDFRDMVAGLNQLMETTDNNLGEVSELLRAIARGDLTARMEGDFHGVFATMRDDANATVAQLTD